MSGIRIPDRMKKFPLWMDKYPIHFTVPIRDGVPVFLEQSRRRQVEASQKNLCHLCGERLAVPVWFVLHEEEIEKKQTLTNGPMHEECARYAIAVCPYLNNPEYVGKKPVRANPATLEWGIAGKPLGPRPGRIALAAATSYRSNVRDQYPWWTWDELLVVDYGAVPNRPDPGPAVPSGKHSY